MVEAGWAQMIDYDVGHSSDDFEFDLVTGELTPAAESRLRPSGERAPTLSELRSKAEAEFCEFVLDQDGDLQDYKVKHLLRNTLLVVLRQGPNASDELKAAVSAVGEEVRSSLPPEPPILDEGHSEWQSEFDALFELKFEEFHPELVDERNSLREERRLRVREVYQDSTVLDAQKLIVTKCDIEVPVGYEFKTAEELGVSDRFDD